MLPLVILSSYAQRVFVPNQALSYSPANVFTRPPEVIPFSICVPNIKNSAWPHYSIGAFESACQKISEFIIAHVIILYEQSIRSPVPFYRFAYIPHCSIVYVIRWICKQHISLRPPL